MSLVPTREDMAFAEGLREASEDCARVIDHLNDAYLKAWNERDAQRRRAEAAEAELASAREALRCMLDMLGQGRIDSDIMAIARAALQPEDRGD